MGEKLKEAPGFSAWGEAGRVFNQAARLITALVEQFSISFITGSH